MLFNRNSFNRLKEVTFYPVFDLFNKAFTAFGTYMADAIYSRSSKLSPRAVLGNDELLGIPSASKFFNKRSFLIFYYFFLLIFFFNYISWQFYIIFALIIEFYLIFLSCFTANIWNLRIIILFYLFSVLSLQYDLDNQIAGLSDTIGLTFLGKITFTSYDAWADLFDSALAIYNVVHYFSLYFLALIVPYFLAVLILFLPLISSAALLCFGYLIGYVLARSFATVLIGISAFCSYYLWFLYPFFRSELIANYSGGIRPYEIVPANLFTNIYGEPAVTIDILFTSKFELENIRPLDDVAFTAMQNAKNFNLYLDFGNFINFPFLQAGFEFVYDSLSLVMVITITTISFFVHLYSISYMKSDPHQVRFFAFLSMFTFFMLILVTGANTVMLYIGWEGVGISSFLLIAFWYTRVAAQKSALKAILINKIGDMFLIIAISFLAYYSGGATSITGGATEVIIELAEKGKFALGFSALDVIALSLILAAFVKSAQLFFHTWLADAMEGPTPVSALLHAATMVTAGVYLIVRFSVVFEYCAFARKVIFIWGLATVIVSSLIALTQYDIKKIIAYSTCSQLGLMFLACGLSAYDFALFHFFNHAFFKCLLFLSAGAIIHQLNNEQDIRKMGGLASKMPFTFACVLLASLSLIGMPGFSGAISKDLILHLINYGAIQSFAQTWNCFALVATLSLNMIIYLTIAYTARLIFYVFLAPANYRKRCITPETRDLGYAEIPFRIAFVSLALMSVFGGRFFYKYFIECSDLYINVRSTISIFNELHDASLKDSFLLYIAPFLTAHALFLAHRTMSLYLCSPERFDFIFEDATARSLFIFFNRKCYFDDFYNVFIVRRIIKLSYSFNILIEEGCFKNGAIALWRLVCISSKSGVLTMKFKLVDHLIHAAFGLMWLLSFSYLLSV